MPSGWDGIVRRDDERTVGPGFFAKRVASMVLSVALNPVPAITGRRPCTISTVISITRSYSSCDKVGDSPVVPQGTMPLVPLLR